MTERDNHKFQFEATQIADAAKTEAEYHEDRLKHWQDRYNAAARIVKNTVSAKVTETEVTEGTRLNVSVEYGDLEAWREANLAHSKIQIHTKAADRYRTDETLYRTQGLRVYELDANDVYHFRLGTRPRES